MEERFFVAEYGSWGRGVEKLRVRSKYLTRQIRYGIRDMPTMPFREGRGISSIPQNMKDLSFVSGKILEGVEGRFFEQVSEGHAHRCLQGGN